MTTSAVRSGSTDVYQRLVCVLYCDLRATLDRVKHLLADVGPDGARGLVELVTRRIGHVRAFVDALGLPSANGFRPPVLSSDVHAAIGATLDTIGEQVKVDPTAACALAIQVVELIAREVEWLQRV